MAKRFYLQKNLKRTEENKQPYFYLKLVIDGEEGQESEFIEIGALWKAKTGNGYTGTIKEGVSINVAPVKKAPVAEDKANDDGFGDLGKPEAEQD